MLILPSSTAPQKKKKNINLENLFIYIYIYIDVEVNNGSESDNIEKNWRTRQSQNNFNVKESQCYNVLILMNHHED